MRILIKNGYVVSMVSDIKKADILIEDDRIKKIGIINEEVDKVIDATNKAVMPGLINAHVHSAMSVFRGYNDELELMNWLKEMWKVEDRMKKEDVYYASMISGIEMLKSGTTTFNDHYFFEEQTAKVAEDLGLRAILSRCIIGEGEAASTRIAEAESLYNEWHNKCNGRIKVCVGIHAPYTCPPDTIRRSLELADRLGTPVHIHYLETQDEVNQIFETYEKSVTDYLKDLNLFNYHVILAHGVKVNDDDIEVLRKVILKSQLAYLNNAKEFVDNLENMNDEDIYNALLNLNDIRYIQHSISNLKIDTLNRLLSYIKQIEENKHNLINTFMEEAIKRSIQVLVLFLLLLLMF